jgi:hypothetical protein
MKSSLSGRDYIERHHSRQHAPSRQAPAQQRDFADAVLQAEDDGVGGRMLRDDVGDFSGIGALDRDQHHAGVAEDRGIFRQRQPVRGDPLIKTLKTRQPQPVGFDLLDHARARQQRDPAARGRIHAADKAADAAGPRYADRSVCVHLSFNSKTAGIAELAACAY